MPVIETEFEAQLRNDGFQEIERLDLVARPGKGRHRHHFAIRELVKSGTFVVAETGEPVVYGSGQIFEVARGSLHDEWIGADGRALSSGGNSEPTRHRLRITHDPFMHSRKIAVRKPLDH